MLVLEIPKKKRDFLFK